LTAPGKGFFKSRALDSLEDCLRAFASEERLDKHDAFFCAKCAAHGSATKTMRVHRFPRCLALHIKRFKAHPSAPTTKLTDAVSFPLTDLSLSHIASDACVTPEHLLRYDLYAVSNHTGSLSSGHYTAACKLQTADGQAWFRFDDAAVSRISPKSIPAQDVYMLFYVQRAELELAPTSVFV